MSRKALLLLLLFFFTAAFIPAQTLTKKYLPEKCPDECEGVADMECLPALLHDRP